MKYFLLENNPSYRAFPRIKNWYGKIDVRCINRKEAYQLPRRELLFLYEQSHIVFTDIILEPFFLVSDMVRDVIRMYEPHAIFKEIILLDQKNEKSCLYHLPVLEEVECLSDESEYNLDRSLIKKAVLDEKKARGRTIFKVGEAKNPYYIVNLDFAESILKRGALGIGLQELDVRKEESVGHE